MGKFIGNTSTAAFSTPLSTSARIKSFSVVNKSGGSVTIQVLISQGSTAIAIVPYNKSLAATEAYVVSLCDILLPTSYSIQIVASGSVDYYFTFD